MRINLNLVNAYLVDELFKADAIFDVIANGLDIILVRLASGEAISIHLIERDIDLGLIKGILDQNARSKYATLFILWSAMLLPDDGDVYRPYDWMSALLTLTNDKIYGYEVYGSATYIFPVYFDEQPVGIERLIRYGEPVAMNRLTIETIFTETQYLTGYWRIADFDGRLGRAERRKRKQPGTKSWS